MTLAAVLLAGGHSRRMGRDKALLMLGGTQLWRRQLAILSELQPVELLVAAPARPEWLPEDVTFVADLKPARGPLAGIAAALGVMSSTHLIALPVDMPAMTAAHLAMLWSWAGESTGIVPSLEGRAEPLPAIYPAAAAAVALDCLAGADSSLSGFAKRLAAREFLKTLKIGSPDAKFYANCNTPDEWSRHRSQSSHD